MRSSIIKAVALCICLGLCQSAAANPDSVPVVLASVDTVYPIQSHGIVPLPLSGDLPGSEMSEQGKSVRGVYIPYPRVKSWKPTKLVHWVKQIGANAVILDIKGDRGRVTFARDLPYAKGSPHGGIRNMQDMVDTLQDNGIYVIGRLVCFKDNLLALRKPESAMRDRRTGKIWKDSSGLAWTDPHSELAHEHIVSVATAASQLGFDEIQLDYVRFPVEPGAKYGRFPNRKGTPKRHEVIASLLSKVDAALSIPLSVDVFGLTAYHPGDRDGLGQSLEHLAPYVDAISPMVYLANWPKKYWANPKPRNTFALVSGAVKRIRERLGDDIVVRPLLQAFRWRAENFGYGFILNQVNAANNGGSQGYLFWNQTGNYRLVGAVWKAQDSKKQPETRVSKR